MDRLSVARGCGKSGMRLTQLQEGEKIVPLMLDPSSDQPHWLGQVFEKANTIRGDVIKPSEGYLVYMFGLDLADGEDQTVWRKGNPNAGSPV